MVGMHLSEYAYLQMGKYPFPGKRSKINSCYLSVSNTCMILNLGTCMASWWGINTDYVTTFLVLKKENKREKIDVLQSMLGLGIPLHLHYISRSS